MTVLRVGNTGAEVAALQNRLRALGFNPGAIDGEFGNATEAAVLAFQRSEGLLADGVVGRQTALALKLADPPAEPSVAPLVTVQIVCQMFPATPVVNVKKNLPFVLDALAAPGLLEKRMVLMALSTIRAETEVFLPVDEALNRFNTSPGGHPFDLYDHRRDLGNRGRPDGATFRGRGFIQLTGRANYEAYGQAIGLGDALLRNPERANHPEIAARLLASFLKSKERRIKEALLEDDLRTARRLVNGGTHGLDRFIDAYRRGERLIPESSPVPG